MAAGLHVMCFLLCFEHEETSKPEVVRLHGSMVD
jgi:hypothetical protein